MQATAPIYAVTDFNVELLHADHLTPAQRQAAERAFYDHVTARFGGPIPAMQAWAELEGAIEAGTFRRGSMPRSWTEAEDAAEKAAFAGMHRGRAVFWCSFWDGAYDKPVARLAA